MKHITTRWRTAILMKLANKLTRFGHFPVSAAIVVAMRTWSDQIMTRAPYGQDKHISPFKISRQFITAQFEINLYPFPTINM